MALIVKDIAILARTLPQGLEIGKTNGKIMGFWSDEVKSTRAQIIT